MTGDVDAAHNLGVLLDRTGRPEEAIEYLGMAARQGDADSAEVAGEVSEESSSADPGARYWFTMAAGLGARGAKKWLRKNPPKENSEQTS
jgi:TPR repeat protein